VFRRHAADLVVVNLLTVLARADFERARARPAVGEKTVHRIQRIDLAVDGGHLLGEVGAEHAGLVEPGALVVGARRAVRVVLEPFRVGTQRFGVSEVAVHARHDAQAAPFGRRHHLPEQVARAQELAAMMKGHARGIERHNATAIQQDGIHLQRGPVIHPRVDVQGERVALVEIDLPAAAHRGVPRPRGSCGFPPRGREDAGGG